MDHPRDDVFPGPAFALDEDWDVRSRQFFEAVVDREHGFGAPKYDHFGWHLSQRLDECIDTAACHGWRLPNRGRDLNSASREPKLARLRRSLAKSEYLIEEYKLIEGPKQGTPVTKTRIPE